MRVNIMELREVTNKLLDHLASRRCAGLTVNPSFISSNSSPRCSSGLVITAAI